MGSLALNLLFCGTALLAIGCNDTNSVDTSTNTVPVAAPSHQPPTTSPATTAPDAGTTVVADTKPTARPETGLHFDSKEKIIKAEINQKSYRTSFKFTNVGKSDVTITKIKSSCACALMKLKKRVYKPGESGEIQAEIVFGRAKGRFVKKIHVTTKAERSKTYTLDIGAIIPEFARVTPRFLRWESGSEVTKKVISVKIIHNEPINVISVTSSNPDWKPVLRVITKGKEYEVDVTPPNTQKASRAALSIEMDYPEKQHLIFRAVARVTQAPKPVKTESWLKKLIE